jgi:hypothetical protein
MSEMAIYGRTKEVFFHYKLPYDVDPPKKMRADCHNGQSSGLGFHFDR